MKNNKQYTLDIGSKLFNRDYIVDQFISYGGINSQIYKVHMRNYPDKQYAAKIIFKPDKCDENFWQKFSQEEITSLRILNKANLIQTYETFNFKNDQYDVKVFIMDYTDGISLRKLLQAHGALTPKLALNLFLKILIGIKSLHNFHYCIIHRDLKPENIMLNKNLSNVTILDFGISSVIEITKQSLRNQQINYITNENDLYGTPPYIIPDALLLKTNNNYKISVQYDFFSLGIILYEMIMGERPFNDKIFAKDEKGHYQSRIIKLPLIYDMLNISNNPTIPVCLENLIFRCIACKPQDKKYRYDKVEEIIDDVQKCLRIIDRQENDQQLIKPTYERIYQQTPTFNIAKQYKNQPIWKQWWFYFIISSFFVTSLIIIVLLLFTKII